MNQMPRFDFIRRLRMMIVSNIVIKLWIFLKLIFETNNHVVDLKLKCFARF